MIFLLYIFLILPKIGILFIFAGVFALFAWIITALDCHTVKEIPKRWGIVAMVCIFLAVITPSKKDTYILGTAILSEKALQSDIGQKGLLVIEQQLDELLGKTKK